MTIPEKDWQAYIDRLSKINEKAADLMRTAVRMHGYGDMQALINYAYVISTTYGEAAAALSAEMYDAIAAASGMTLPAAEVAETATYSEVARTVQGVAKQSQNEDMMAGAVERLVKRAGADTTLKNARRDGAQFAWIPSGDTCAFCITLASRGWQRQSQKAMKNGHAEHIHANCNCQYAIRFSEKDNVAGYDPEKYERMYYGADGDTPKERINAMRRAQYAEEKDKINAQKRAAYAEKPIIKRKKFTEYALNPTASPDKAKAFKEALGYTTENCDELISQIERFFDVDKCREKGHNEYGERYEQIMRIEGANGKSANVCTAWIKKSGDTRLSLTSVYVTKKKVEENA